MFAVPSSTNPANRKQDVLSDVLDDLRVRSLGAGVHQFAAPWHVRVPKPDWTDGSGVASGRCGGFYALTEGNCRLEADGLSTPMSMSTGDLVITVDQESHELRDDLNHAVTPVRDGPAPRINGTSDGPKTTLLAGRFFVEDREYDHLLAALPPFVHIPANDNRTVRWLENTSGYVSREAERFQPGAQSLRNQVSKMLLAHAIRAHIGRLAPSPGNGLLALLDPDIGMAMTQIHAHPEHRWTVVALADLVSMSRSAFSARFTLLVGQPPLRYLSNVRLARAARALEASGGTLKQVARSVGYESEASFSKAFKRVYGVAPGVFRKEPES